MKVRLYVARLDEADRPAEIVEDYTVPDGSWVQTRTAGALPVYAVLEPACRVYQRDYFSNKFVIVYEPVDPPYVPERLSKLVDGRDRRWGRNGSEWFGRHRHRYGGATLDRAREYARKCRFVLDNVDLDDPCTSDAWCDWPVLLSEEEIAMILEEGPVRMAGSVPAMAGLRGQGGGKEQLPLFALGG